MITESDKKLLLLLKEGDQIKLLHTIWGLLTDTVMWNMPSQQKIGIRNQHGMESTYNYNSFLFEGMHDLNSELFEKLQQKEIK